VLVLIGILATGALYAHGLRRLWRRAGAGRGVPAWRAGLFYVGLVIAALALTGPLDALAHALFAAHMVQHLLLMLVVAPLVAAGAPLVPTVWALADRYRSRIGALVRHTNVPLAGAFVLHSLALWLWHIPRLYDSALDNSGIHMLEHVSFLATAALFWWTVLHSGRHSVGLGVLYVFALALESTILGALLTFSRAPWYAAHLSSSSAWGLSPLEDQQLAGLIMWIPGGLVYLAIALALFSRLFARTPDPEARTPAHR
jgi:putative membrane protein